MILKKLSALLAISALCACGGDDDSGTTVGPDADNIVTIDAAPLPSVDASLTCPDPTTALPTEWRPILSVATGAVEDLGEGSYYVDGSAGGIANASDNPYIYLRFTESGLEKVEIDDIAARESASWDLAIKRMVVIINGGDSGAAGHEVATIAEASLDDVTSIPASASFTDDQWADDDCNYSSGFIGEPNTAVGTWYGYDTETSQLTPLDSVFIIRRQDGSAFAFEFGSYYHGDQGSAHYAISFASL